mmetsp:Transcript_8226/g.24225  ORF Transcript_8226/g.24225 Transcript_8226/m.24225 type:complete len:206 (+) Transcript_8226:142-759(+)
MRNLIPRAERAGAQAGWETHTVHALTTCSSPVATHSVAWGRLAALTLQAAAVGRSAPASRLDGKAPGSPSLWTAVCGTWALPAPSHQMRVECDLVGVASTVVTREYATHQGPKHEAQNGTQVLSHSALGVASAGMAALVSEDAEGVKDAHNASSDQNHHHALCLDTGAARRDGHAILFWGRCIMDARLRGQLTTGPAVNLRCFHG